MRYLFSWVLLGSHVSKGGSCVIIEWALCWIKYFPNFLDAGILSFRLPEVYVWLYCILYIVFNKYKGFKTLAKRRSIHLKRGLNGQDQEKRKKIFTALNSFISCLDVSILRWAAPAAWVCGSPGSSRTSSPSTLLMLQMYSTMLPRYTRYTANVTDVLNNVTKVHPVHR